MIDVGTRLGRFLARLKFCAVEVFEEGRAPVLATRCSSVCGKYLEDSDGVDGDVVEAAEIDRSGKVTGTVLIDFGKVSSSGIVKVGGNFYLDGVPVD